MFAIHNWILGIVALLQIGCSGSAAEKARFHDLGEAAKAAFQSGQIYKARDYAEEMLRLAPKFHEDWNYGNAIHDGNMLLGRLAVFEGRIDDAKMRLLEAGKTPGSPQLKSFGPNMSLAKELLAVGEEQTVLQYFGQCRKFWANGQQDLDRWEKDVRAGKMPAFGASLHK